MLNGKLSRREFLWLSITSGAGLAAWRAGGSPSSLGIASANERINVGIVGIGTRGYRHLAEYLKLPNVAVAAICDVDETKLRAVSEAMFRAGLPRPFLTTDYRYMLEKMPVDILSVATPKHRRVEIGIAACEAGKHLMLEKPFSQSIKEGQKLVGLAAKTERLVQQRENHAFVPLADVYSLTHSAGIGEIQSVRGFKKVSQSKGFSERVEQQTKNQRSVHYDDLIDFAFDEIDIARCLLEVETPANVTTAYFGANVFQKLPAGVALQFDFSLSETKKRRLNFELRFDEYQPLPLNTNNNNMTAAYKIRNPLDYREKFQSRSVYTTSCGEFSVECSSDFEQSDSGNNSWANLVSCVRENNQSGLQNPIIEAQKSCNLVHLAAQSLRNTFQKIEN